MNTMLFPVQSLKGSNFTEGLAQWAASAMNNLPGLPIAGPRRYLIRALKILTMENFGPELNFFASAAGFTTDPATDYALARFGFVSSMGEQLGGSGLWRYYVDGLAIPYVDLDTVNTNNAPTLHAILQNISGTAKTAGAPGAIMLTVWVEPMGAF